MTFFQMIDKLAVNKIDCSFFRLHNSWDRVPADFYVTLKGERDGIKLEITQKNPDLQIAMETAFNKFFGSIDKGIAAFKGPLLEAPQPTDEIPF